MKRVGLVLLAISCGGGQATAPPPKPTAPPAPVVVAPEPAAPPAQAEPPTPGLRLPDGARPIRYEATLDLDADRDTFTGEITIHAELTRPARHIWLHARHLEIASARADDAPVTTSMPGDGWLLVTLPAERAAGPVELHFAYSGKAPDEEMEGIFRDQEKDTWYLFTQLEALGARRVFPCFDEPMFKVPWKLTIRVPAAQKAYSNTPGTRTEEGGKAVYAFQETKPLPSYLVAFAVGPFEEVGVRDEKGKAPIRVLVTRGRAAEAGYAKASIPPLLDLLEKYFGSPYPYEKLDFISVPSFPGAMENPGLVTFNSNLLLRPDAEWTPAYKRIFANIAAHELGHQWFGDLVTMVWWDDIWLNEAFATWIAAKVVDQWQPKWDGVIEFLGEREGAMHADSKISARQVRQPIENEGDIGAAFDAITYKKGGAVIRMFEAQLGEAVFRDGVRKYLEKHAWKNATSKEFLEAIAAAANRPEIVEQFSAYLDKPGVPLVSFELACDKGAIPTLKLTQERYVPLGSKAPEESLWPIPVCVRFPVGAKSGVRTCQLLSEKSGAIELRGAKKCPAWFSANADGAGYYRTRVSIPQTMALVGAKGADRPTDADIVAAVEDLGALVASGHVPIGEALAVAPEVARHKSRHVVDASVGLVAETRADIVPEALRPNAARFLRKTYGARARALGWTSKKGEDEGTSLTRRSLVPLVALLGEDPELVKSAQELAKKWLADPKSVEPDAVDSVLVVAARHGDRALWDKLQAKLAETKEQREVIRLGVALGSFRDPALAEEARKIAIGKDMELFAMFGILGGQLQDPVLRDGAYAFVKANLDTVAGKLPAMYKGAIAGLGGAFCDEEHRKEVDGWWREKTKGWAMADRTIKQALEEIDQCMARRKQQGPSLEAFLKKY